MLAPKHREVIRVGRREVVIAEAAAKSDTEAKVREALRGGVSAGEAYERFGVL